MNIASDKAKEYGITALKVLILSLCFVFIYSRISSTQAEVLSAVYDRFTSAPVVLVIAIPLLAVLNWALEIRKWQILASGVTPIGFRSSAIQCLAAISASLWTPNRIGEYGAKALYYQPANRKKIMLMKFFGNSAQLLTTLVFGIPALAYLVYRFNVNLSSGRIILLIFTLLVLVLLGYRYRKSELLVKGLSIANVLRHFREFPAKTKMSVLSLSALRYLVFGGMFLWLLFHFEAGTEIVVLIGFICSVYLISSVIPSFVLFDVAVKGGVAVWLASIVGLESAAVLGAVLMMWIMNFVMPAIIGSYFVIRYKPVSP